MVSKKPDQLYFANISAMEVWIFMKFKTKAHNRVVDQQTKDLCTNVLVRVKMCTHTFMPRAHMFLRKTLQQLY